MVRYKNDIEEEGEVVMVKQDERRRKEERARVWRNKSVRVGKFT